MSSGAIQTLMILMIGAGESRKGEDLGDIRERVLCRVRVSCPHFPIEAGEALATSS